MIRGKGLRWVSGLLVVMFSPVSPCPAEETTLSLGPHFRMACWTDNVEEVAALLKKNPPLEETDNLGRTPLLLAHGNAEIVKLLLAHGAKATAVAKDGDTPLGDAAQFGVLASAQMLVAAGADINHANQWGRTPLALAAREGHDDLVTYLLAQHASLTAGDPYNSALSYAVWKDHLSIARILLEAGQSTRLAPYPPPHPDKTLTILELAVQMADPKMIDLLLDHGADINEVDGLGQTALTYAAMDRARAPALLQLLARKADPNRADHQGFTTLMMAIDNQAPPIVEAVLDHGADPNQTDNRGRTALMEAVLIGFAPGVDVLLRHHANFDLADHAGETALTYAGDRGALPLVRMLESAGAQSRPFHIIPKPFHEKITPAQAWALAVGAIYAQCNGFSHDSLAQDPARKGSMARGLAREWDMSSNCSAAICFQSCGCSRSAIAETNWSRLVTIEVYEASGWGAALGRGESLLSFDIRWRGKLNVAWNACREANLVREGVTIGYISEAEGWPILMRVAHRVQQTYGSWREMNSSFLDSRENWAGEINPSYQACAELLLNPSDPNSPWSRLSWNTNLNE